MLARTILLHCSCHLDKEIVAKVCEDTITENCIIETVRADVLRLAPLEEKTVMGLYTFLKMQFDKSSQISPGFLLNKSELLRFFHHCQVYLTSEKLEVCWDIMDYDVSGHISFDEIFAFIQPDSIEILKQKLESAKNIKQGIIDALEKRSVPRDLWGKELYKIFSQYDVNKNGSIEPDELRQMLTSLGIVSQITTKQFNIIVSILDVNMDGTISWVELHDFVFPSDETVTLAYRVGFSSLDEVKKLKQSSKNENIAAATSPVLNMKVDTEVDERDNTKLIEMSRARINAIKFHKGQETARLKSHSFDAESNESLRSFSNEEGVDDTGFETEKSPQEKEKKKKKKKKSQDRMRELNLLLTGGNTRVENADIEASNVRTPEITTNIARVLNIFNRK